MHASCRSVKTCQDYELHTLSLTLKKTQPAKFTISVSDTKLALDNIKVNKATGPDRIPPWALKVCSHLISAPATAICNSSLREGVLPTLWKTAPVIPLSQTHPPVTIENDVRPISLCKSVFFYYSKAFDLINYDILLNKMVGMEVPAHLDRWMAAFLLDREQRVKNRRRYVKTRVSQCSPGYFIMAKTLFSPYQLFANAFSYLYVC